MKDLGQPVLHGNISPMALSRTPRKPTHPQGQASRLANNDAPSCILYRGWPGKAVFAHSSKGSCLHGATIQDQQIEDSEVASTPCSPNKLPSIPTQVKPTRVKRQVLTYCTKEPSQFHT